MRIAIAAALLFLVGCSDEAIVLATIPESAADGGKRAGDTRCTRSEDCGSGRYCKKHGCEDQAGECEPYPTHCGDEEQVVCGCDGVTYFNECLRRAAGIAEAHDGDCTTDAVICGGKSKVPCAGSAVCATLLGFGGGSCDDANGICYVLPATCPAPSHSDRWDECEPVGRKCLDTCQAIRSGKSFFRASRCE
jgi:hypothetical protein